MTRRDPQRASWAYYAAIVLFIGVLAFAVLGLVRSSSLAGASTGRRPEASPTRSLTPSPAAISPATGRIATPQIPPPTPSAPTEPPSRTYLHPPPEYGAIAPPGPAAQPRR